MILTDKNTSWVQPFAHLLTNVSALGSLTRMEFRQILPTEVSIIAVYINDQGREVFRTHETDDLCVAPEPLKVKPPRLGVLPTFWDKVEYYWISFLDFVLA